MIGVVLWSDADDSKAVFWCEDQGDLAYYESCANTDDNASFFDAGDMVQFDVTMEQRMRKAHNPRLLQEKACAGLPESLRRRAKAPQPSQRQSARIIPFSAKPKVTEVRARALKA